MKIRTFVFALAVCLAIPAVYSFAEDQTPVAQPYQPAPAATSVQGAVTEQQPSGDNKYIRKKSYEYDRAAREKSKKESEAFEKKLKAERRAAEKLAKDKKKAENEEAKKYSEQQKRLVMKKPINQPSNKIAKYIGDAREYFATGELAKAQASIIKALNLDLNNKEAILLKNRMDAVAARMVDVKKDFSEQCYYKGEYLYKSGNILGALHMMQMSLKLNPQSDKAKALLKAINDVNELAVRSMGKEDGIKFRSAVKAFVKEDYSKAVKLFRQLQPYYPEATDFLVAALSYSVDENNNARSKDYVREATENIRHERYGKAQENLYLALEMNRENINAMVLYEQVRPDTDTLSMGATGTYHKAQFPADLNIEPSQQNPDQNSAVAPAVR
jgi:hypothetical protein